MAVDTADRRTGLVQRRKEEILIAAKRIFAKRGYRRTRVEQIADRLGVGKGTLYRYFENKEALFLAVFENGIAQLLEAIESRIQSIEDPAEKIATGVKIYFEFFDNDRELIEIMMQVRSEFKNYYMQYSLRLYSHYIENIRSTLRAGIQKGQFRQIDVDRTADAMSDLLAGTLQSFYTRQKSGLLIEKADAVISLILNGLNRQGSPDYAEGKKT